MQSRGLSSGLVSVLLFNAWMCACRFAADVTLKAFTKWGTISVIAVSAYRREPVSHANAVVNGHPVFAVLFFLLFFLAHDLDEPSRRILGEPPEAAVV